MTKHIPWLLLLALTASLSAAPPNLGDALREQLRLVTEQPGDPALHNDLGNLLLLADDLTGAETAYRRALEIDAEYADAWFNLALLLQQTDRGDEAGTVYRALLDLEPAYAWAHYQLGVLHHERGEDRKAIEAYAQAFALDTSLTFAEINPAIIDNDLFTQALLRSAKLTVAPSVRTPRQYADAGRIRGLMLETLDDEPTEQEAETRDRYGETSAEREIEAAGTVRGDTVRGGARFESGDAYGDGYDERDAREVRRIGRPEDGVGEDRGDDRGDEDPRGRTVTGVTGVAVGVPSAVPESGRARRPGVPETDRRGTPTQVQPRARTLDRTPPPVYVPPNQRRGASAGGAATGSTSSQVPAARGGSGRNSTASLELRLEAPAPAR